MWDVGYSASGNNVHLEAKLYRKSTYGTPQQEFLGNAYYPGDIYFAEYEALGDYAQYRQPVHRWDIRDYELPALPRKREEKDKPDSDLKPQRHSDKDDIVTKGTRPPVANKLNFGAQYVPGFGNN
jgi:hypothetical protein